MNQADIGAWTGARASGWRGTVPPAAAKDLLGRHVPFRGWMDGCAGGSRDAGWMGTSHGSRAAARHDPSFSVVLHAHASPTCRRTCCGTVNRAGGGGGASLCLPKSQALAAGQMR